MKLTVDRTRASRSLQRRWALTDAEPVRSYLPPYTEFVPADLRIWWSADAGHPVGDHTLHIYAWPAERDNHISASWRNGFNNSPMPEWIRELSDVVHEDLIANATGTVTGTEDRWAYSADRRWTLEDAPPVPSLRHPYTPFIPAELSIRVSVNAGDPDHDRHRITAHPDRRERLQVIADWDGGIHYDGSPRYDQDLPDWIRALAEDQREQLVAFAAQCESERGTR